MTYEELRKLKNQNWKFEYIKQQLIEDDVIMELLHEQQLEIDKAYEHLADAREEVEELPHAFEKAKKNMAKRL